MYTEDVAIVFLKNDCKFLLDSVVPYSREGGDQQTELFHWVLCTNCFNLGTTGIYFNFILRIICALTLQKANAKIEYVNF